jgi:prefoldin alpha subunit
MVKSAKDSKVVTESKESISKTNVANAVANSNSASNVAPQKKIQLTPELANNLFNAERKRHDSISAEMNKIQRFALDTDRTIFALEELKKSSDDSMFVNLGSGVYLNAKIEDKKKAKFMVGTDVFLEKSFDDILSTLKERKQKLSKDLDGLQKLENQSQNNLNQLYGYLMAVNKNGNKANEQNL